MSHRYPIFLDVTDRLIVIVGGGKVAARKAARLIDAGARRIRCVAPRFDPDFPAAAERIVAEYSGQHLDGASLIFAATDRPEVTSAVVRDARRLGLWVNRADSDEADPGDFVVPAKVADGTVIIAVSAGSAALSAALRDHLAVAIDQRFVAMAEAMQTLRPQIKASGLSPARRAEVFRTLAQDAALSVLNADGIDALGHWLLSQYPEIKHG